MDEKHSKIWEIYSSFLYYVFCPERLISKNNVASRIYIISSDIRCYFMQYYYSYDVLDVLFPEKNTKEQLVMYAGRCSVSTIIDIETFGYYFYSNN